MSETHTTTHGKPTPPSRKSPRTPRAPPPPPNPPPHRPRPLSPHACMRRHDLTERRGLLWLLGRHARGYCTARGRKGQGRETSLVARHVLRADHPDGNVCVRERRGEGGGAGGDLWDLRDGWVCWPQLVGCVSDTYHRLNGCFSCFWVCMRGERLSDGGNTHWQRVGLVMDRKGRGAVTEG